VRMGRKGDKISIHTAVAVTPNISTVTWLRIADLANLSGSPTSAPPMTLERRRHWSVAGDVVIGC
jgi:hypothetical protein